VNRYRSSMKDDSVQALLCARSWLHGFEGMIFYSSIIFTIVL